MKKQKLKIIILDETNGKSKRGAFAKEFAEENNIPYFTDIDDLLNFYGLRLLEFER